MDLGHELDQDPCQQIVYLAKVLVQEQRNLACGQVWLLLASFTSICISFTLVHSYSNTFSAHVPFYVENCSLNVWKSSCH